MPWSVSSGEGGSVYPAYPVIQEIDNTEKFFEDFSKLHKSSSVNFGEVRKDFAIINESKELGKSTTLRMEKLEPGLYFDNLVIQELPEKEIAKNIIRYSPDERWYKETMFKRDRFVSYTGAITVYGEEGDWLANMQLLNGKVVDYKVDMTTSQCFYEATYTIGCYITCWVSGVVIDIYCPGSSGGGGNYGDDGSSNNFGDDGNGGGSGTGSSGSSGGSTIGTSPFDEFMGETTVTEQRLTRICGQYTWKAIGSSQYANISDLYLIVAVRDIFTDKILELDLNTLCISIPYSSSVAATNIFNSAWEKAKLDLYSAMRTDPNLINEAAATATLKDYLFARLKAEQAGSTLSARPCNNTPSTAAKYCL